MVCIEGRAPAPWRYSVTRPGPGGRPYLEVLVEPATQTVLCTDEKQPERLYTTLLRDGFATGAHKALAEAVCRAAQGIGEGGTLPDGKTLGAVAAALDARERETWDSLLREASGERVDAVGAREDGEGGHVATVGEHARRVDVRDLGRGTGHLVGLMTALLKPSTTTTTLIDDLGAYAAPERLRVVAELIELGGLDAECPQVVAATHRPLIADWLRSAGRGHVFVCSRDGTGRTRVRTLPELDRFRTGDRPELIADLASEGWLQTACEAADEKEDRAAAEAGGGDTPRGTA